MALGGCEPRHEHLLHLPRASANGVASVWIDRRLFSNLAGIDKDLFEAWDVDCHRQRMRPERGLMPMTSGATEPTWSTPRPGASHERLLRSVCADLDVRDAP